MVDLDIDTEVLIALVKIRPVLWDKTNEIYKDREATRKAWEEVCISLNKHFQTLEERDKNLFLKEVVLKRWTNVRDSFARFCRKEKEEKKSDGRESTKRKRIKKYIYHNQMRFLRKLYDDENAEENYEIERNEDALRNGTERLITTVYPNTRIQDTEAFINTVYSDSRSRDTERVSNAEGEDNLTSAETASTASQHSGPSFNKRKWLDESELQNSKVHESEKSDRHLSFFKGIIPSLGEFNEREILKFQMGVLQLIGNIKDLRNRASHAQPPAQFFSFPSQPGLSAYLPPVAASYPSGQPIFPTFWSAACPKCSTESTTRESSSHPMD
ncbi:unnamed protein product [Larinioides sclopetarius]|uniref:MADF domain-containing protein n=1 Tax=Larinioides sclopetarius TaxID=280406 RepID=A0AAV1ZM76_9ARAC